MTSSLCFHATWFFYQMQRLSTLVYTNTNSLPVSKHAHQWSQLSRFEIIHNCKPICKSDEHGPMVTHDYNTSHESSYINF